MLDRWMVVLSGDALVDELRKLPDEVMSFHEATVKVCFDPTRVYQTHPADPPYFS